MVFHLTQTNIKQFIMHPKINKWLLTNSQEGCPYYLQTRTGVKEGREMEMFGLVNIWGL